MPEASSPFSSFMKWVGGILATVISGLLLFWGQQYLTVHPWLSKQKPEPRPQKHFEKPLDPISIDGRVLGCAGTRLIDNALVRLQIASIQEEQQTDSNGRYAFSAQGFDPKQLAAISVEAQGYMPFQLSQPLADLKQQKEQHLDAQPQRFGKTVCQEATLVGGGKATGAIIGGLAGGGKGAAIGAGAGAGKPPVNTPYVRRLDAKQIVAH